MTQKECRNQGLIRQLMQEIEKDYEGKTDGWFLFANEHVLDFYPKFGFRRSDEFEYAKAVTIDEDATAENVVLNENKNFLKFINAMKESCPQSSLWFVNHEELKMFYLMDYMRKNVYLIPEQNAYVVASLKADTLYLHQVFSLKKVNLDRVAAAFGREVKTLILGFSPLDPYGFLCRKYQDNDTVLYVKGESLNAIEQEYLRIPELSHT